MEDLLQSFNEDGMKLVHIDLKHCGMKNVDLFSFQGDFSFARFTLSNIILNVTYLKSC